MSVKAWYKIPKEEEESFLVTFWDETHHIDWNKYSIVYIEFFLFDSVTLCIVENETEYVEYIPLFAKGFIEWLLCNHQFCEEWTV